LFEPRRRDKERKILKDLSREGISKEEAQILFNRVNQEAIEGEFASRGIPFKSQPIVQISYKGSALRKSYQPDFICYEEVLVEIKAISSLSGLEEAQVINYLKGSGFSVGLLLNFGSKSLREMRTPCG